LRRNLPLVYIVENNGVYGLTKGQFSATAEEGLELKKQGTNPYMPIDIAWEALVGNATFVARSFAGDPKQVKELIKAALSHDGIAVLDIISPCVTFNNSDEATHSYAWGREHEVALHELSYVPPAEEIMVEYGPGEATEVTMHDGSKIVLNKLGRDHDPTDRSAAMRILEEANACNCLLTGLIYYDPDQPSMRNIYNLTDVALNRLPEDRIRPGRETIQMINDLMF
jgi:2-oxoglutarate ferredoxin oxidoreductase subunit beta